MTAGSGWSDPDITESAAREYLRSYAKQLGSIVTRGEQADIETQRVALETALEHFERVVQYGTTVAYHHRQWAENGDVADRTTIGQPDADVSTDLRTLSGELAIDRLEPFDLDDLRAHLQRDRGIEAAIEPSDDLLGSGQPGPTLPTDRSIRFERWLLTEFGIVVSIPIRDSEATVRRILKATAEEYDTARTNGTMAVEQLAGLIPILESLYRLYVRLTLGKPLSAATDEELSRTMVTLTAAVTTGFEDG
ncbi:MAG: hypothetical protein SVG88_12120 [Halobacteriales archaeon]|nr:hypothetical protein [Halobacteriales archaeon]